MAVGVGRVEGDDLVDEFLIGKCGAVAVGVGRVHQGRQQVAVISRIGAAGGDDMSGRTADPCSCPLVAVVGRKRQAAQDLGTEHLTEHAADDRGEVVDHCLGCGDGQRIGEHGHHRRPCGQPHHFGGDIDDLPLIP
nr:hypothetical protein [Spongiactinospora gelatinilytica]